MSAFGREVQRLGYNDEMLKRFRAARKEAGLPRSKRAELEYRAALELQWREEHIHEPLREEREQERAEMEEEVRRQVKEQVDLRVAEELARRGSQPETIQGEVIARRDVPVSDVSDGGSGE